MNEKLLQELLDLKNVLDIEKDKLEHKLELLVESSNIKPELKPSVFLLLTETIEKYVSLENQFVLTYYKNSVEELLLDLPQIDEDVLKKIKEKLLS